jgi:hypothetical protein
MGRISGVLSIIVLWSCGGAPHEPREPLEEQAAGAEQEPVAMEHEPAPPVPEDTGGQPAPGPEPAASLETEPVPNTVEETQEPAPAPKTEPPTGTIVSRKGKVLTVAVDQALPEAGAEGTLLKYFEKQILGMHTTGWLDIAAVKVKQAKEGQLQLVIVEEHSQMTVNGKKVDHFVKGTTVKLELGASTSDPSD